MLDLQVKIIFTVLFIVSILLLGTKVYADDRQVAEAYFSKAKELSLKGDVKGAKMLLDEAVDFLPDYSETLFLLGKIECLSQGSTFQGIPLIERALSKNTWTETDPSLAQAELSKVYVTTRRYTEALSIINSLRQRRLYSPTLEILRARACNGLLDFRSGDLIFESALELFPEAREVYLSYIQSLATREIWTRASQLVERGIKEFPAEPEFLFYRTYFVTDPSEKKKLIDAYLEKGGRNPSFPVRLLETATEDAERLIDIFFNFGGAKNAGLLETVARVTRPKANLFDYFVKKIGVLEGEKIVDMDEDGFFEEKYLLKNNELETLFYDRNQDGNPEIEIYFEKNVPVKITSRLPDGKEMQFLYNVYPRCARVRIEESDRSLEYELVPDALLVAPLQGLPALKEFRLRVFLNAGFRFPDENVIGRVCYAQSEDPTDKRLPVRKWELNNGKRLVLHEDSDRDSRFERIVVFDDSGAALRGTVDFDGDGIYEVHEVYTNGVLTRIDYDENNDGKPEFSQSVDESKKEWDLNNDGKIDIIATKTKDGKTIWEYTGLFHPVK